MLKEEKEKEKVGGGWREFGGRKEEERALCACVWWACMGRGDSAGTRYHKTYIGGSTEWVQRRRRVTSLLLLPHAPRVPERKEEKQERTKGKKGFVELHRMLFLFAGVGG